MTQHLFFVLACVACFVGGVLAHAVVTFVAVNRGRRRPPLAILASGPLSRQHAMWLVNRLRKPYWVNTGVSIEQSVLEECADALEALVIERVESQRAVSS